MATKQIPNEAVYLLLKSKSRAEVSRILRRGGIARNVASVSYWLSGQKRPSAPARQAIRDLLGVPADAWDRPAPAAPVAPAPAAAPAALREPPAAPREPPEVPPGVRERRLAAAANRDFENFTKLARLELNEIAAHAKRIGAQRPREDLADIMATVDFRRLVETTLSTLRDRHRSIYAAVVGYLDKIGYAEDLVENARKTNVIAAALIDLRASVVEMLAAADVEQRNIAVPLLAIQKSIDKALKGYSGELSAKENDAIISTAAWANYKAGLIATIKGAAATEERRIAALDDLADAHEAAAARQRNVAIE